MLNLDNDIIEMIVNISHEIHHLEQQHSTNMLNLITTITINKDLNIWFDKIIVCLEDNNITFF